MDLSKVTPLVCRTLMLITAYPSGAIHLGSGANVIIEASGNNNHDHHHHDHRHDHAEGGDRAQRVREGERHTVVGVAVLSV